ncbi:cyclin-T2-like [Pelobates fuscus]|uniref:cyclin-T2-like n=1 Tax=Pelobates fuscus TaxID=191477 RepID=UPI002FE454E9
MEDYGSLKDHWLFSQQQLDNTPSRQCGVTTDKELLFRQEAASLIQDLGQRLDMSQLTINTAVVYMHRFYMQQSFTKYHRYDISSAALVVAAKALSKQQKTEDVLKMAHAILYSKEPELDPTSQRYLQQEKKLVCLESILTQTLGFQVTVEHPHMHVMKYIQSMEVCNDFALACYLMATSCLHVTTLCLQYKPAVLACLSIHMACKWSRCEMPVSTKGKLWWQCVDQSVSPELLEQLSDEFLHIYQKTPNALRRFRQWRPKKVSTKPKSGWTIGKFLLIPLLANKPVTGIPAKADFPKAASSAFRTPVHENAGKPSIQIASNLDKIATSGTKQVNNPKPKNYFATDFKNAIKYFSGSYHGENFVKAEYAHKTAEKQQILPPSVTFHRISLEKYRERAKQKMANVNARNEHAALHKEPHQNKHNPAPGGSSVKSTHELIFQLSNSDKDKKESFGEKDTGVPLQSHTSISPVPSSKETLKRKITSPPTDSHSSSNEGSGGKRKHH